MMSHQYTLEEIGKLINAEVHGDPHCVIVGITTLQDAQPGQISFLDNPRYNKYLTSTKASAVILRKEHLASCPAGALVMDNPHLGFAKTASLFEPSVTVTAGIHPTAIIAENCQIHSTASIGPYCVIAKNTTIEADVVLGPHCIIGENTKIGANSRLWANVTLYRNAQIGQRTIIHSGVIIGADGFGFAQDKGKWHKVPQLGGVRIGDDVEIGANTTIDRGALGDTIIENGVKLDNQIQIAHNVRIGANTIIAGCVGIAGSAHIGKNCLIGGGALIAGHLEIADGVIIMGGSGVDKSITQANVYSTALSVQPNDKWLRNAARLRQLDKMAKRLREVEKVLNIQETNE